MTRRLTLFALLAAVAPLLAQESAGTDRQKGSTMLTARGTFEVKVTPAAPDAGEAQFARYNLDKAFKGDISGTSSGVMLAAGTPVKGSAAYVALEKVTGTVNGRTGSFILMHNGTMQGQDMRLTISVVPDSGTEQLVGISGTFTITIAADGTHSYELTYTL